MHTLNRFVVLAIAGCLAACGGGGGGGKSSNTPSAPAPDTAAPSVPANVAATATGSSSIEVTWSAASDAGGSNLSGYRIFRDGATTALTSVQADVLRYVDSGLSPSTTYRYVVRAFDGAGNISGASAEATATTLAAGAPSISGLDARPANNTCVAWKRPQLGSIQLQRFTSLSFNASIALLPSPDGSRWYVVEQGGVVKRFSGSAPASAATAIDISDRVAAPNDTPNPGGEMGLLGMAFAPGFPTDPRVFLSYTTLEGGQPKSRISSFRTADAGLTFDPATETVVLAIDQPEANHNGGHIAFGKDGHLYIGLGDGGGGGDQHGETGNGQRLTTLLGKMLRIDVRGASGYEIPADNPFAGRPKCGPAGGGDICPEIFAYGFRNPWRWSFDRENGELWLGDVGQNRWEEVNVVRKGGNYGWRCREGAHDYSADTPGCSTATLIDPVTEYDHSLGSAITGGYVYRGPQDTAFKGRYIFGDFGSGRIWAWIPESASAGQPTQLADTDLAIASFAEGHDGELYVVDYSSLYKVIFQAPTSGGTAPSALSATGCVNPQQPQQPAEGLIPYDVNAPFWSVGASKLRWIALPANSTVSAQASGDWDLPTGSVLVKNFSIANKLIETRLFMRHSDDGSWGGYSYAWNDAQTDATLVRGGALRDIGNGQQWIYPSEAQCLQCHTKAAGYSLGLESAQLNKDFTYAQTDRTANELITLSHIQVLSPAVSDATTQPRMPNPSNASANLNDRARAYLHTNCAQCHRPEGGTPSAMDLRYTTTFANTKTCNATPQAGDLGLGAAARLIAPGNAANSILVERVHRRDEFAMPPVGSNVVDADGVALLTEWINSLSGC